MKSHIKLLLPVLLLLASSCSDDDTPSSISNTNWEYASNYSQTITEYGMTVTIEYDINSKIIFNSDNEFTYKHRYKVVMNDEIDCDSTLKTGTYSFNSGNGEITLTIDGKTTDAKLQNNKLTLYTVSGNFVYSRK